MGTCLSKKKGSSSAVAVVSPPAVPDPKSSHTTAVSAAVATSIPKLTHLQVENELQLKKNTTIQAKKQETRPEKEIRSESPVKKEIFLIRHRKSHEGRDKHSNHQEQQPEQEENQNVPTAPQDEERLTSGVPAAGVISTVGVRTSSCTKEEVDAILIQCGRLSRSSSGKATNASSDRGKKYSGSKRSYDFDHCDKQAIVVDDDDDPDDLDKRNINSIENDDDEAAGESRRRRHRQRQRQSSSSSSRRSPSHDRRRTPSRERDQQNNQRGERRVSRSPGRRASETSASANANNNPGGGSRKPAKMVSVPATVSSLAMDKSNNGGDLPTVTAVKRISVKRNVGSEANTRVASSPRSQSPARMNTSTKVCDENQQPPSLSRSSSRKAEQSPYRRNALSEIDTNSLTQTQQNNNSNRVSNRNKKDIEGEVIVKESSNALNQKPKVEMNNNNRVVAQGTNNSKTTITKTTVDKVVTMNCTTVHQPEKTMEEPTGKSLAATTTQVVVVTSEAESQKPPQTLTRSRSSRLSRDFDIKPETLVQPTPSYTALLLEDIQNFHQKTNNNTGSISLPACVTKACSIVEEIADLNSSTSSNLSCAFSEDRRSPPSYQSSWNQVGKIISDTRGRDPLVETEVEVEDDVMEPSFHKYVTVRRGGGLAVGGGDMEDQESSGSNSFVCGSSQQNPGFSTSWEPNSVDSGDCWTSRSNSREENVSGLGLKPRHRRLKKESEREKQRL